MSNGRGGLVVPFLVLALGIVGAALIVSGTWRANRMAGQTLNVVGSAKQEIVSDLGIFRCAIRGEGATAEAAYRRLRDQQPTLLQYFAANGFDGAQVRTYPVMTYSAPEFDQNGRDTGRILKVVYNQRFEVQSADVRKIESMAVEIGGLVERGVYVEPEMPEYHYTRLAEMKIEVQALAARDAEVRARKIAEASGARLGVIRNARMGVLQITPRHSTMISDYGVNDVSSIEKEITAVVNASFSIE